MEVLLACVIGAVCALVAGLPVVCMVELGLRGDKRATIVHGIGSVVLSFIVSSALLFVAFMWFAEMFVYCGCSFTAVLVGIWVIEVVRVWYLSR